MNMPGVKYGQTVRADTYVAWLISWPYRTEKFLYFGSKTGAEDKAKKLQGKWTYKASIKKFIW